MKITTLLFALIMLCFTMSAQDYVFPTAMVATNSGGATYDESTRTISWLSSSAGTGAVGYDFSSSNLDASTYTYLVVVLTSVESTASCRIYYSDGTNETTNLTTTSNRTIYNITLNSNKKSAITKIEFRLFGTPPTTIVIENMYLSNDFNTALKNINVDPSPNMIFFDIYGNKVTKLERNRIYISGGKKFVIN